MSTYNTNNCFQNVLNMTGLHGSMQDNAADNAYLLLKNMAAQAALMITLNVPEPSYPADTYDNQYQEVLHRLRPASPESVGFAWKRLCHLFNDFDPSVGEPV